MWKHVVLLTCLVFSSIACVVASEKPIVVSAAQLLANPRSFNGKRVCVVGYLRPPDPHTSLFYPNEDKARKIHDAHDGIVVFAALSRGSHNQVQNVDHGYVKVVGKFRHIHLWRKEVPNPKGGLERTLVTANVGYGWGGLHENTIEEITELTPVPRPK